MEKHKIVCTRVYKLSEKINPATKYHDFEIISWPYSRNIVKTILEKKDIKYKYERINKRFDKFQIKSTKISLDVLKECVKTVEKEARKIGNTSENRNKISDEVVNFISNYH